MKKQRLILPPQGVHIFKFSGVLNGRQPCFQEVSTKRYQEISFVYFIRWKSIEPEDLGICLLQGLISERLKDYWPFGIPVFQGLACEVQEAFPHDLSKHPDSTLAVPHRCFGLGLQDGFCFSIGYGAPCPCLFQQRSFDSVWVVDSLQGCLAPHAQPTPVDGMERIALNLDGPALSVFGQDATAGWTLPAGGSIPSGLAGYHVIRSLNEGVQGFFWLGGAAGGEG